MRLTSCWKCSTSSESIDDVGGTGESLHVTEIDNDIQVGEAFFIKAQTLASGDRFVIDFCLDNANKDIALRLEIRVSTNSLVRNSRIKKEWDLLENVVPYEFHLVKGMDFELQVFFEADGVAIACNDMHIAYYNHRLAFNLIRKILVHGAIVDVIVERKFIVTYPEQRLSIPQAQHAEDHEEQEPELGAVGGELSGAAGQFLALPYYSRINQSFFELGHTLLVTGKVAPCPKIIKVKLQVSRRVAPPATLALQVEVRFTEKRSPASEDPVIALNSFKNSQWSCELKCDYVNGLRPGGDFNLLIVLGEITFRIHVNDSFVGNYPYVINPSSVDTCCVDGDIQLKGVGYDTRILRIKTYE